MKSNQPKDFQNYTRSKNKQALYTKRGGISRKFGSPELDNLDIKALLQHILYGVRNLMVALKYQFYKMTAGAFEGLRFPWFKIGLAAFVLFILTQKDIQFSVDMKAPLAQQSTTMATKQQADELGLVQPISLKNESAKGAAKGGQYGPAKIADLPENLVKGYIKRFSNVAITEMERYHIPASVKMAWALLESHAGQLAATQEMNNHFGVLMATTTYGNAWENWRANSELMKDRYPSLFEAGISYKRWSEGIAKVIHPNLKGLDKELIKTIESYQLYLLDEH